MVPFDDDDDDKETGGKGGAQPRDGSGRFEGKSGKSEPEDDDVELEDGEDGSVVVRQREPSAPRVREEKKGQRYQEMEMRSRQAEMERDHYRMMFELQSRAAPQQSSGPDPEVAKLDGQIAELRKQRTLRYESLIRKGTKATPQEREEAQKELEEIELRILDTWADRREASRPRQQQQAPDDTKVISQMMRVEYPEVFQDRRAWQYAQGLANLQRSKGDTLDLAKTRDILAQARTFRQNGYQEARPRPTERQKRNYSGRPSGAQAQHEGSLSLSPELQKKILLTHKKPGESDAQTLKRWAAKNGKKFQERLRERA